MSCKLRFFNFIAVYYSMPSCALHRKQTSLNLISEKSKIRFTGLPGLEFGYIHRSRTALLPWGWQKKPSSRWTWARSALSKWGLHLSVALASWAWWRDGDLITGYQRGDRYNSLTWREIIVRTEPNFLFETDAGTRGNTKNCSLAGSDQR